MATPNSSSSAGGGVLIAAGCVIGAFIGLQHDQATIGLLIGLALGVAGALLIWWRGRG